MALSDKETKDLLRGWATHTTIWSRRKGVSWLRAQPVDGPGPAPRFMLPGAERFRIHPDGLWITLGIRREDTQTEATYVDCLVVEACGSSQNFNDKRSRYAARTTSLMLELSQIWLNYEIAVRGGPMRKRRELLQGNLSADRPVAFPLRHLRVLYALPDEGPRPSLYEHVTSSGVMEGHEYVCPQRILGQYTGQDVQKFLKRMAPDLAFFR